MTIPEQVFVRVGVKSGVTVAIFCGVHGNERAGILAVDALRETLPIEAGTVYFVYANPVAIKQNIRYVKKNLNRLFVRSRAENQDFDEETARSVELMNLLDTCDVLLDLHAYRAPADPDQALPFAICEERSVELAKTLGLPYVISGFAQIQVGGSDGYMGGRGKIGVCVELGAIERADQCVELGKRMIKQVLASVGCLSKEPNQAHVPQNSVCLALVGMYKKQYQDFQFSRSYKTFDRIEAGEVIASEGGLNLVADQPSYLLFPQANDAVGIEAFLLAVDRKERNEIT